MPREHDPGTPSSSAAIRTRRSHRKSRNGCAECKRRHIRCDERRPVCSNCSIAERACAYPPIPPPPTPSSNSQPTAHSACSPSHPLPDVANPQQPSPATSSSDWNNAATPHPPPTPPAPTSNSHQLFTIQHLALFHHAETAMDNGGVGPPGQIQQIVDIAIRHAADAPYLVDQILAYSALHLAAQQPDFSSPSPSCTVMTLRHQATELQTRAIANFTRTTAHLPPDDTTTSVPRFLFSSVLSLHSLADTLSVLHQGDLDFHAFIESFADCVQLHRGVRAVILPIFEFLTKSELRPLLAITQDHMPDPEGVREGSECLPLQRLLDESQNLGPTSLDACRAAVDKLQWSFDLYKRLPNRNGPHAASAFSVMVSLEYVEVLRKHRPEALVILSYYGVLLHRCRMFWMFRDSGALMIHAIANHLGGYWREAMSWPLHVIEVE